MEQDQKDSVSCLSARKKKKKKNIPSRDNIATINQPPATQTV